jgi:hypothetical protein
MADIDFKKKVKINLNHCKIKTLRRSIRSRDIEWLKNSLGTNLDQ